MGGGEGTWRTLHRSWELQLRLRYAVTPSTNPARHPHEYPQDSLRKHLYITSTYAVLFGGPYFCARVDEKHDVVQILVWGTPAHKSPRMVNPDLLRQCDDSYGARIRVPDV